MKQLRRGLSLAPTVLSRCYLLLNVISHTSQKIVRSIFFAENKKKARCYFAHPLIPLARATMVSEETFIVFCVALFVCFLSVMLSPENPTVCGEVVGTFGRG